MRAFFWFLASVAALVIEVAVFSNFGFFVGLPLQYVVLLTAIVVLPFRSGFWVLGGAGVFRDVLAPSTIASPTLFAIFLFFAVWAFLGLTAWDEPLRRIAAFAAGVALTPFVGWVATTVAQLLGMASGSGDAAFWARLYPGALLLIGMWFFCFGLLAARGARRHQERALGYIG